MSPLSSPRRRRPSTSSRTVAPRWSSDPATSACWLSTTIDWARTKPLSRVKEGVHVIRTLLDDGAITFDGEFFKYKGLFTFARPVQERVPVKIGSMRGPKSFEVAGEFSDGCHHALSYTRQAYEYGFEHFSAGARAGG